MSKGGSKPKKPKMSIDEKTQAAVGKAEWDHYKQTYVPIERDYLRDAQKDRGDRVRAQGSGTVMRAGTDNMRLSALAGGTSDAGNAVGTALTETDVSATGAERSERDQRTTGALGVGRELATTAGNSLSALGRSGANAAIGEMRNKLKVSAARDAAIAQGVGSLAGAGAYAYMNRPASTGPKTSFMSETDLRASSVQNQNEWAPPLSVRRR